MEKCKGSQRGTKIYVEISAKYHSERTQVNPVCTKKMKSSAYIRIETSPKNNEAEKAMGGSREQVM